MGGRVVTISGSSNSPVEYSSNWVPEPSSRKNMDERVSLAPLTPEVALGALLAAPPDDQSPSTAGPQRPR